MSDFDKEAEREKLRKKFARDEEKRASTQRMSELLLKGATMTNKHCNQCSDPLFRYNGQTFCPSCQADADADATAEPDHQSAAETGQQTESDHQPTAEHPESAEPATQPEPADPQPSQPSKTNPPGQPAAGQTSTKPSAVSRQPTPDPQTEGLAAARQSLERTVTRFARRAEETEDPRRARELLTAAHEAAATLSELQ